MTTPPLRRKEFNTAVYQKPASIGEYRKRTELRKLGLLPGETICKRLTPKLIPISEFQFDTIETRLKRERHYKYLNLTYGLGMEAAYITKNGTFQNFTAIKRDIQIKITSHK